MNIISATKAKLGTVVKGKGGKKLLGLALLMVVAAVPLWYWQHQQNADKSAQVTPQQAQVVRDDIVVGFDSDGTIDFAKVNLRFGVKGTIAEILVNEGDEVKKGEVIARLDDQDYQDQYQIALAKLGESQDNETISRLDNELRLATMDAELEQIRDEYREMQAIPEAYAASELKMKQLELANKEKEYANLKQKCALEQAQGVSQDELAVKMAKEDLEDTILYSPVNGRVLALANKVGESLTDEQDFATVHENNVVNAVSQVIEYDIGQIKVGQKVYVTAEAVPDKKFAGTVTKINALPAEASSGLVNYEVEVKLTDPGAELRDGMTCSVSFVIKEVTDCLIVPYDAVRAENGKQYVTVVGVNGQQEEREIKTNFTDGTSVEVLEGLKVNETVVYAKK